MNIGEKLIYLRVIVYKYTLQDVENGTSIKKQTISAYEHNRKTPTIEVLKLICDFYKMPLDFVVGDFFNSNKKLNNYALLEKFCMFLKLSKSKINILNNSITIQVGDTNLLNCLDQNLLNNWIDDKLVSNILNKDKVADLIVNENIIENVKNNNL